MGLPSHQIGVACARGRLRRHAGRCSRQRRRSEPAALRCCMRQGCRTKLPIEKPASAVSTANRPFLLQVQAFHPGLDILLRNAGRKALSFQPIPVPAISASSCPLSPRPSWPTAEGNHGFSGKVVCLNKAVHRPGVNSPPDGVAREYGVIFLPQFSTVLAVSSTCRASGFRAHETRLSLIGIVQIFRGIWLLPAPAQTNRRP